MSIWARFIPPPELERLLSRARMFHGEHLASFRRYERDLTCAVFLNMAANLRAIAEDPGAVGTAADAIAGAQAELDQLRSLFSVAAPPAANDALPQRGVPDSECV